jgi:hypothetical protein
MKRSALADTVVGPDGKPYPKVSEDEFLRQVIELAQMLGWEVVHFRPARTKYGWATPVQGTLGKGWPDLFLCRERDGRVMAIELKSQAGKLSDEQRRVLEMLDKCGIQSQMYRPSDFDQLAEVLR